MMVSQKSFTVRSTDVGQRICPFGILVNQLCICQTGSLLFIIHTCDGIIFVIVVRYCPVFVEVVSKIIVERGVKLQPPDEGHVVTCRKRRIYRDTAGGYITALIIQQ